MMVAMQKLFQEIVKKGDSKDGFNHKDFIKAVKKGNCMFDND